MLRSTPDRALIGTLRNASSDILAFSQLDVPLWTRGTTWSSVSSSVSDWAPAVLAREVVRLEDISPADRYVGGRRPVYETQSYLDTIGAADKRNGYHQRPVAAATLVKLDSAADLERLTFCPPAP
ncbi:MAG: hypothetical protein NTY19_13495 [Planctomycetota bacterium]|nr:hypothetical protein [Planctomycetota bacterium]